MAKTKLSRRLKKSRGISFIIFLILVIGLAAGVIGLQSSKLLGSKANSGCTIVQTDQGPGCWCSNGGWQFHCGVPKGEPAPDQCISDCQDRNTDNPDDNTPKADKCDKGKVGGPCSGQYQYACGGDGCKAECNNYPKSGRWVLTGNKNCGKPGDIKPTPTPTSTSRPTSTATPRTGQCNILDLQTQVSDPIRCNSGGDLTSNFPYASVSYKGNCSQYKLRLTNKGASPEILLTNVGTQIGTQVVIAEDFITAGINFCDRKSDLFRAQVVRSDNYAIFRQGPQRYINFTVGGQYDCYGKGRFCHGY